LPIGLGDPVIEKLDANLAKALLSIGGVKGVEFGDGFLLANMCGSQSNDPMYMKDEHNEKKVCFKTNHLGGIQGGVSTGNQLTLRLSIKAVPSIEKTQKTINKEEKEVDLLIKGRHDVCLIPRILPVIDSMISLTLADAISHQKLVSSNDTDLNDLREAIEKIDEDFLIALYRRNQISKRIGDYKKKNNLQVYDKMRERFLLDSLSGKAKAYNLSESFIRELWSLIMTESKKQQ